jgi:hypothetical protein
MSISRAPTKTIQNKLLPSIVSNPVSTKHYIKRHIEQLQMKRIKNNGIVPAKWAVIAQKGQALFNKMGNN